MLACEAAYQLEAGRVLTDEQRERLLHELRIPLTRVEVEVLEVECLAAAREATPCACARTAPVWRRWRGRADIRTGASRC